MAKLLIWIGVVFAVLFGMRLVNMAKARKRGEEARGAASAPPAQSMVRCVRCGIFVPTADAKPGPGGPTCGEPGCLQRAQGDS